jgi:hypothetical protein
MISQKTIISRTGTRHIVGFPAGRGPIKLHAGRISTLCDFGIRPDEVLEVAVRDCEFCLRELDLIRQQEEKQAEINEQKLKAAVIEQERNLAVIDQEKLVEIDKFRQIRQAFDDLA